VRKHYLLLAHDQPEHVGRLIDRLDDDEATFWLHLDPRADRGKWSGVMARHVVVAVEPRVPCLWGTWSMVEATLAMVDACLASGEEGYLVMLSGQTYPVKSAAHITAYLTTHQHVVHMDLWDLPERWPDNYRDRLDYFCIPRSEAKGDLRLLRRRQEMNARELVGWTRRLLHESGLRITAGVLRTIGQERPEVAHLVVGGSQWWGMPWDVVVRMIDFHRGHPQFAEFLRWSQFPDETFFQTLLVAMDGSVRDTVAPTLTYVDWTEGDWDLPRAMSIDDVPALLALPDHALFARKFLFPSSSAALDALDDAAVARGNP
jgi:hypothetical protein